MENRKIVAIRVDSSIKIGSGHVMRCLTVAKQLKKKEIEIVFICAELPGTMMDWIRAQGYTVESFPCLAELSDKQWEFDLKYTREIIAGFKIEVSWLIVDHYGLDERWEKGLRPYIEKIMVIDDLANRPHDCDMLLDQNLYSDMGKRYQGLVSSQCRQFLGPQYVILRSEFYEAREKLRRRDGRVRRILIFFGGSDSTNETEKTLQAIRQLNRPDIRIDVVVGMANPHKEQIKRICVDMPQTIFYCQINNMAQLIANADLAIGAGGTATWERCFLGLPSITIVVADNQKETTKAVAELGATLYIGESNEVTSQQIAQCTLEMIDNSKIIRGMSQNAIQLIGTDYYNIMEELWGNTGEMK